MPTLKTPEKREFDIVIVGGGLAGASLAVALGNTPYRVAVVEAFEFEADAQPSYDERTIALTYSAKHIFTQIGVWDAAVEREACPLKSIHISNKGHFGITHLDHRDAGTEALGYVVATRALGQALMEKLKTHENVAFFCPYQAEQVKTNDASATLSIRCNNTNKAISLNAKLVVVADGGRSPLLDALGFSRQSKAYTQSALLSIVKTSLAHQNKAYERFLDDGPLALLPMNDQRFAVVWTLSPARLEKISAMSNTRYIAELQQVFGNRAGRFSDATPRKTYPLSRSALHTPYAQRVVALGNAAHTVHPVAGQGFNLGLRDVATLVEQLMQVPLSDQDVGGDEFLKAYSDSRHNDTQRVGQFTDGLLTLFTHNSPLVSFGRNLGLVAVENLPFVKRALLKRSMGLGRNQPRLARGLKIRQEQG